MGEQETPGNEPHPQADDTAPQLFSSLQAEIRPCISQIFGSLQLVETELHSLERSALLPDLEKVRAAAGAFVELFNRYIDADGAPKQEYEIRQIRHDLRTPIGHIVGYSEILQEEFEDEGAHQLTGDLQRLSRSARQLLALVNESFRIRVEDVDDAASIDDQQTSTGAAIATAKVAADILVIDDNASNRDLLTRQLERHGHRVDCVENGRLALQRIEQRSFDLLLLDVMMPELDGFQVLEYIKQHPVHRHLPVIMMSANDELESVVRCIEMGAEDYIPKPINPILLFARVEASLEKKMLRDQEQQYLRQIEIEQARSEMLLLNILPPSIAQRLKHKQDQIADSFPNASVLFADVIGFTTISSRLLPETLVLSLNTLFKEYDSLSERYGMEKIKTIGDAYMVASGLPVPREDHAISLVEFALDMIEQTRRLQAKLVEPFEVRIGINSGPVVAGVIGRKKFCYDLWGDTVNIASRLSSVGSQPGVLISESTYELVKEHFTCDAPQTVELKGKGPTVVHKIIERK